MSNFSGSTKPADENSTQEDLVKTSRGAAGVAGKPSMEEISARLSAKLALLEASQQDLLHPATALKGHDFELPLSLASRSDLLASTFGERASSLHGFNRSSGDAASAAYQSANPRFKTEICRNFKEKGTCLYGDLCQFAHGKHELRGDVVRHAKYKTKPCQKYWVAGYCAYGPRCNFVHQEVDRKTALQLLSEGCGKQLTPNIAQSVHDFRPRVANKVNDSTLVGDFKDFGNEAPPSLNGLQTKLDQLSFNGIGKDSGFGDSRQAMGYPWQIEMIGGTISTPSYPTCSSLSELAGPPLATSNCSEVAYGQPRSSSHPKELKAEAMQLWDNHFMKGRGLSQFRSSGDDDGALVTKAACNDPLQQLNKFQPDSMALKVERMEMKSKTTPVASQQVTTLTSSSKALPINYGLFADFLIEDRSRLARHPIGSERSIWSTDSCK